jgi:hypothetical protein
MPVMFVAAMDIRDVYFDDRSLKRFQRI